MESELTERRDVNVDDVVRSIRERANHAQRIIGRKLVRHFTKSGLAMCRCSEAARLSSLTTYRLQNNIVVVITDLRLVGGESAIDQIPHLQHEVIT